MCGEGERLVESAPEESHADSQYKWTANGADYPIWQNPSDADRKININQSTNQPTSETRCTASIHGASIGLFHAKIPNING